MAWQVLQPAINLGLSESDFWEMTIAEIQRYIEGATWRYKTQAQMDYALANLIGVSNARLFSKDTTFPKIEEVYPGLFGDKVIEEQPQEDKMLKSINRFLAYAAQHNAKMREEEQTWLPKN